MFRALLLLLRLGLGAVFVYAAWTKLRAPWPVFAMAVDAYKLLPHWAVIFVARTLPWAELLIGVLLLAGRFLRLAAAAASLLLLSLFAIMLRSYASGLQIDCGCFGPGDTISIRTLLRDGALLAASLSLAGMALWKARTKQKHA
jgi:uncharacterized membrane protein YphA (DoxX/SURF4 family)